MDNWVTSLSEPLVRRFLRSLGKAYGIPDNMTLIEARVIPHIGEDEYPTLNLIFERRDRALDPR
jgi:hypothetical protein